MLRLIVAEYAFRPRNVVGRIKGRQGVEGESAFPGEIMIKPN